MQVFLPCESFFETAKCLDKKRLFKQLVECRQVLATIGVPLKKNDGTPYKASHVNHPIHKMWKGHAEMLKVYHNYILDECLYRGIKTMIQPLQIDRMRMTYPSFIGDKEFHDAHKSNLLKKMPEHYGQFGWDVEPDLEYLWS